MKVKDSNTIVKAIEPEIKKEVIEKPIKIIIDESKVLGTGSGGTVGYEGTHNGRFCAVK